MYNDLKGKIALVTGSTQGIGLAIAKNLSEYGCFVILNSRKKKRKSFYENLGFKHDHYIFDNNLEKKTQLEMKKIFKKYKKIDFLICNVGHSNSNTKKINSLKEWKFIFENNFFSALNVIFSFLKFSTKKDKIKIICISSVSGMYVSPAPSTYAVAKAALNSFVRHVSKLYTKNNVFINCIAPGNIYFKGGIWDKKLKKNKFKALQHIKKEVPEKRFGSPREIANLASYLCSEQSSFINGTVISIDGGQNKQI